MFRIALILMLFGSPRAFAYTDEIQSTLVQFSAYKPTYFLIGIPDTKAQISVKIQPLTLLPVYVGYSQLLIWELFAQSAPIRDINYNPEIFYRFRIGDSNSSRWLDLAPLEHESNGKSSRGSRSWNRIYIRYSDTQYLDQKSSDDLSPERRMFHSSLKIWSAYGTEGDDFTRYRGIAELTVGYSGIASQTFARSDLTLRFYPGGASGLNPLLGGQELSFRFKLLSAHVLPLTVIQVFHGYGENLLDYRDSRMVLRAGIGL